MDKLKKWRTISEIKYLTEKTPHHSIATSKLGISVRLVSKNLKKNPNTEFDIKHTTSLVFYLVKFL